MNKELSLTILRIVLGVVVGGYSAALAIHQLHGNTHIPLLVLAIAELIAAILLLIPRTVRVGGIALIVVFAIAAVFHILHGEFDVAFLAIYAAAALAVIPHGDMRAR
jgi:hypothetical protein